MLLANPQPKKDNTDTSALESILFYLKMSETPKIDEESKRDGPPEDIKPSEPISKGSSAKASSSKASSSNGSIFDGLGIYGWTPKNMQKTIDDMQKGNWTSKSSRGDGWMVTFDDINTNFQYFSYKRQPTWYPGENKDKLALVKEMLDSPVEADVTFLVGKEEEKLHSHKCILYHRAPGLYKLAKNNKGNVNIKIPFVSTATFRTLLSYIYTGIFPIVDNGEFALDVLMAADRFGIIKLKLHTESEITSKFVQPSNASEWLIVAEKLTCPLLKEKAMDIYTEKPVDVMTSPGWKTVEESNTLLNELLRYSSCRPIPKGDHDYANMRVGVLRDVLEKVGLALDGKKETLAQRLKDHHDVVLESKKKKKTSE